MSIKPRFSVVNLLIAIILILLLVSGIVSLNNKNSGAINALTFEMESQNFQQNLALIKSQWLLNGRPGQLDYSFRDQRGNVALSSTFMMSNKGWPKLSGKGVKHCQKLLEKVTNRPFNDSGNPIFMVKVLQKEGDIVCQFCDAGNNDKCFNYAVH